jgi:hypothetical protein
MDWIELAVDGISYRALAKEKNEMGGACSAYGGEDRRMQGFGRET